MFKTVWYYGQLAVLTLLILVWESLKGAWKNGIWINVILAVGGIGVHLVAIEFDPFVNGFSIWEMSLFVTIFIFTGGLLHAIWNDAPRIQSRVDRIRFRIDQKAQHAFYEFAGVNEDTGAVEMRRVKK